MNPKINFRVVRALVKRDLRMYFSNPSGYVFVTLFIFLSAAAAFWQDRFFLNNLANLDQLNGVFPYLLIFFIPALTMSVWAEERQQGTDELLLTLPATDLEVVLGKYMATLGVYTASLVLSLSHVIVLLWLGRPDLGLMFGNYVGYWLIGAALIAVGMLASLLTSNMTIAFILGAVFCSVLVFIDAAAGIFSQTLGDWLAPLGVFGHFGDFSSGVISFAGLLYFLSVAGLFLYLNVLILGRRHWPREAEGYPMWLHHLVRALALFVAVISANVVLSHGLSNVVLSRIARLDVTAERLHTLSGETRRLLSELPNDRPVFIQAYISPSVPEQYVQTREDLLGLLKEIDAVAGSKVQVLIQETEPYTEAARDAREKFGITSREIPHLASARAGFEDVFLGVAFTCGAEEQVIPFFDRGLPTEYEIARSIRVVAKTERKKIGVVNTRLRLFGGLDFQTMRSTPSWSVVSELEKQYETVQINPASEITEDVDAVLVLLPSSLNQEEMDNLLSFIKRGVPALVLVDPLPVVNIGLAPAEEPGADMNPFMRQNQPPPEPKGNIQAFMAALGVRWDPTRIVWDTYNPHPDLAHLPPEVVFVGRGNENSSSFNANETASSALQELVFLYPGDIDKAADTTSDFEPLLRSGRVSGELVYYQVVQRSFLGVQLNRNLPHRPADRDYILAARVRSSGAPKNTNGSESNGENQDMSSPSSGTMDVIVVADVDFVSEQFFDIRRMGVGNLSFDNVTFFLNCIDVLVGDESFVALRNRRLQHRTLERVEAQTQSFIEQTTVEEQQAEEDADKALGEAQNRLDEKVQEVRDRPDLDAQTKQIMARNLQEVENRRFEVLKTNIGAEKEAKIAASKENMESQIRRIQSGIRTFAVLLPPIPVFVLGVWIFVKRQKRAREGARAARRLRA